MRNDTVVPMLIRAPNSLKTRLEKKARKERRSMNAQALKILEEGLRKRA